MIRAILFDLDGTIIDTNELIIETFLHVLKDRTPEPLTRDYIAANMGLSLREQLKFFAKREDVDDLIPLYREYNLRRHDDLVKEFPHAREVMAALRAAGKRIAVVTNKARTSTMKGLRLCGMEAYVDAVVTTEDAARPKPDPDPLFEAMKRLGVRPEEAVMVGDSHYDILAAHRAGVRAVGVSWSLKGEAFLRRYGADWIIRDMRELPALVGLPQTPSAEGAEDRNGRFDDDRKDRP
jgi:pyrophosphatase PpaX